MKWATLILVAAFIASGLLHEKPVYTLSMIEDKKPYLMLGFTPKFNKCSKSIALFKYYSWESKSKIYDLLGKEVKFNGICGAAGYFYIKEIKR